MLRPVIDVLRAARDHLALAPAAKAEYRKDRRGLSDDPGIDRTLAEAMGWVCLAQDNSGTRDGGVARHYSLQTGWSASYPETTGYLIPTMLRYAEFTGSILYRDRAQRMLDWLVSIQLPNGAFQGGMVDQIPVVPVTFNTGQILIGLVAGTDTWGDRYRMAMTSAAEWLVATQDDDGAWRRHASPFAGVGDHTYDTHVAWALFEAARCAQEARYGEAAMRNVYWALSRQHGNGWFSDCDLNDPLQPLTHTIGYTLRGVLEAYRYIPASDLLHAAIRTADGALSALRPDGWLPGRLNQHWQGEVPWVCLTGSSQIAHCWFMLYDITGDEKYLDAGRRANQFVRRTIRMDGPIERRGGVRGSFPVSGGYAAYEYINWASKFTIDANLYERAFDDPDGNTWPVRRSLARATNGNGVGAGATNGVVPTASVAPIS